MASTKETQLSDSLLSILQNSPQFRNLSPATRLVLNEAVKKSVEQRTPELINEVETSSNRELTDIPKNLVGIQNPVDIVGSNLNTTQLNDVLNTSIGDNLTTEYTEKFSKDILNNLKILLPPQTASKINFNLIQTAIEVASAVAAQSGVKSSIDQYSNQVLSGEFVPQPVVPDIDSYFGSNPSTALSQIGEQFDSALSNEALSEARKFNIQSNDNIQKLATQTVGFIDPSATYPTEDYRGKSEVSKLAQGDVTNTIIQKKEKERTIGIQLPNGQSWEQPNVPFKGEYPYNKVMETESGHTIEIDDTPGSERIHVYHKSGTFIEIDTNGTIVKKTKGSSYEIIERNGYISVSGDANLSVKGSIKIFVGGDADIEVEGDTNIKCLNDITMQAAGRIDMSASEEINIRSANINIEADEYLNIKSDIDSFYGAGGKIHHKANSTIYHQSLGGYNIKSTNDINLDSDEKIYFNSDKAQPALLAKNANIGTIGLRKDIFIETITDPVASNYLDKYGYSIEDSEFENESINKQKELRQIGILSDEELTQEQVSLESDTPTSKNNQIVLPSDFVLGQTYLPDNFQLSNNFTLGMLSSKAAVTNNSVISQAGLSYGQIVYNLQGIALNICEPILSLYPNMIVTSCFRTLKGSSSTSDHPKGKAVDIQIKGASKQDYYDIAKKLATILNYDKLLLEYKTYGTGLPWIHISFDVTQQRNLVLTYLNDKKYGDGLISLA